MRYFYIQVTFELCRDLVDEWVLVSEDEISLAVYKMLEEHCKVLSMFYFKWQTFSLGNLLLSPTIARL